MRDFTVDNGRFFLNGRPIYLSGVLLQPNFPITLIAPHDRDLMVKEIKLVKDAGFNLIRCHLRPAPPGYLDLADEAGLLIYAETSLAWIRDSPRLLEHGRREVQALIERDFNHPSVVFWGLFNENRPATAIAAEPLIRFTRSLDPTRVVVDNSGGSMAIDQDFGWIDRASLVPNRETARQHILDVHLYLGATVPSPIYDWLRGLGSGAPASAVVAEHDFGSTALFAEFDREQRGYTGQVFVSELGSGGMSDLDETLAGFGEQTDLRDAQELRAFRDSLRDGFRARRLDRLFEDMAQLYLAAQEQQAAGNTSQIEAVLVNPRVSGYIITQINDVAYEFHAGLLDLWRNPKLAYYASQRLNQPHVIVLHAASPVAAVGGPMQLDLTLLNRAPLPAGARLELVTTDPAGVETALDGRAAPLTEGIHELGRLTVAAAASAGRWGVQAKLVAGGEALAEAYTSLLAVDRVDWPSWVPHLAWLGEKPAFAAVASGRGTPGWLTAAAGGGPTRFR